MNKKNIGLLAFGVFFVTVFEVATPDQDIESSPQRHKLSDRILVLTSDTPTFNNVTAISTDKGIVVVDITLSPATAARLQYPPPTQWNTRVSSPFSPD